MEKNFEEGKKYSKEEMDTIIKNIDEKISKLEAEEQKTAVKEIDVDMLIKQIDEKISKLEEEEQQELSKRKDETKLKEQKDSIEKIDPDMIPQIQKEIAEFEDSEGVELEFTKEYHRAMCENYDELNAEIYKKLQSKTEDN